MSKLTIVANIQANSEKVDLVKSELLKLIKPTQAEEGCINYDLHQDHDNPAHFLFYENWQSRELWQAHMQSQHISEFNLAVEGAIDKVTINEMTFIG